MVGKKGKVRYTLVRYLIYIAVPRYRQSDIYLCFPEVLRASNTQSTEKVQHRKSVVSENTFRMMIDTKLSSPTNNAVHGASRRSSERSKVAGPNLSMTLVGGRRNVIIARRFVRADEVWSLV